MIQSFGVRVSGFGFSRGSGFGFRVSGFEFRVHDSGLRVSGFGFVVQGFGFRVPGTGRVRMVLPSFCTSLVRHDGSL